VRRLAVALVVVADLAAIGAVVSWHASRTASRPARRAPVLSAWDRLDPQTRCQEALALVTQPDPWPTSCTWRDPGGALQGQSFPPPKGPPPWDDPRIEVYVAPEQTRAEVAHAIAHELGHMRHTREPTFAPEWLAARGLAPETPWQVWTEDYAEVFAALFSPPVDAWRAPTPRPGPDALAVLKARFFPA
jgi:hypothetical protein